MIGSTTLSILLLVLLASSFRSAVALRGLAPPPAATSLQRAWRTTSHLPLAAAASDVPKAPRKKAAAKKATSTKKASTSKKAAAASATPPPARPTAPQLETMRKADLISLVAKQTDINKKYVDDVLVALLQGIQDGVASGKKVSLPGFGIFAPRARAARKGRNPQTGEEIQIAASIAPAFTASKAWKDSLNDK